VRRRDGQGAGHNGRGNRRVPRQCPLRLRRDTVNTGCTADTVRIIVPVSVIGIKSVSPVGNARGCIRVTLAVTIRVVPAAPGVLLSSGSSGGSGSGSGGLGVGEHPAHLDKLPSILTGRPGHLLNQLIRRQEPLPSRQTTGAQLPPGPVRQRLRQPHLPGLHQTSQPGQTPLTGQQLRIRQRVIIRATGPQRLHRLHRDPQ
jgi:hypothetical protein